MDAAGDQQAVDPGIGRAGDVGAQAVADRQQAAAVGDAEQLDAAVVDRWIWLAMPAHPAADRLVLLGQRTGAERRPARMDHHEIGVGANHRQAALVCRVQDRRVVLDRVLPAGRPGVEDEIGLVGRLDKSQAEPVADLQVPVGADMQASPAECGIERIVAAMKILPGFFARGHDPVVEALRHADNGDSPFHVVGPARCVRQQHQPLAGADQLFHAIEHARKRRGAVMHHAPQIENEPVIGRGERPHAVNCSKGHRKAHLAQHLARLKRLIRRVAIAGQA